MQQKVLKLSDICASRSTSKTDPVTNFLNPEDRECLYFRLPGPLLDPWPRLPALAPNLYLPALAANLYLLALVSNLCLSTLVPSFYLPALAYNFITSLGPDFLIYRHCLLNLYLYLRPWPTICIIGLGPEFAFTLFLIVEAVVVVIEVVVVSLE